jgi:hypothetical protein
MARAKQWIFPLLVIVLMAIAIMLIAIEGGYRVGRLEHALPTHETESFAADMAIASVELPGLMLAFTFGWSATRFDARRTARSEEAQAISRFFRLAAFLPPEEQDRLRATINDYIELSLRARNTDAFTQAFRQREGLHHELWRTVVTAGRANENSEVLSLFVESANDVLDAHLHRSILAVESRIPVGIGVGLFGILAITMGLLGYRAGLTGSPRSPDLLPLVLSIATVVYLIGDLDRPLEGLLHVHDEPLEELKRDLPSWR